MECRELRSCYCTQVTRNTETKQGRSAQKTAQGSQQEAAGINRLKLVNAITVPQDYPEKAKIGQKRTKQDFPKAALRV